MAPVTKVVWNEGHGCSGNGRVEQSVKLGDELEKREILKKKKIRSVGGFVEVAGWVCGFEPYASLSHSDPKASVEKALSH